MPYNVLLCLLFLFFEKHNIKGKIMRSILKISAFILRTGLVISISCKKETSCEGCAIKNKKPPISVAGPDQVITLPIDSVSLDGRSSSDPDGSISSYLWTKISGPVSFNITKPSENSNSNTPTSPM